jgi:nitroreductase
MAGRARTVAKAFRNQAGERIELLKAPEPRARASGARAGKAKAKPAKGIDPALEQIDPSSPWHIDDRKMPRTDNFPARARWCLKYAVLAPSSHNSQPWRFRIGAGHIDVLADRSRALPVCDPHDRELTISCGCALFHLRLAMRRMHMADRVCLLPDARDHDLLARVEFEEGGSASVTDLRMLDAVIRRRTVRAAFRNEPVPDALVVEMTAAAQKLGATLSVVAGKVPRAALASLVGEADQVQFASRSFRRELALWMHHNRTHLSDGIPGHAMGMSELESLVAPLVVRTFDLGHGRGAKDEQLALHSPLLCVLGTESDTPRDWLNAGQALASVLLLGTAAGVSASYLNQPVEVPELRPRLARLVPAAGVPQIVLRMGLASPEHVPAHTPRRRVEDVTISG